MAARGTRRSSQDLTALVQPPVDSTPNVVDGVALARLYGEPLFAIPTDLYIPPDALEIFLETFEGPLDLLLYLIRKQNFNVLDIPMAQVTKQYLTYIDQIREHNLELAAEYLLMAALLIEIKSRMLLPVKRPTTTKRLTIRARNWCGACWNTNASSWRRARSIACPSTGGISCAPRCTRT